MMTLDGKLARLNETIEELDIMVSPHKWELIWWDAEDHSARYTNWKELQSVARRLLAAGFEVRIRALK